MSYLTRDIRLALLGCGAIGKIHAKAISSVPGAKLAACFDLREAAAHELADTFGCRAYTDYGELLSHEDVDAVVICTPSGLHTALAEPAAHAGKHVICEKPLDTSVERAQALVKLCADHGVRLFPISQHRLDPAVMALKSAVEGGKLGTLYWGSAHVIWYRDDAYYLAGNWRGTRTLDGGALMNQSIHYVDLLLHLMGTPVAVSGMCAARRSTFEAEDVGIGSIRFAGGALGSIEGTTDAKPGLYSELSIYGEKGSVIMRNDAVYYVSAPDVPELEAMADPTATYTTLRDAAITPDGHIRQYKDIFDAIRTGRPAYVTPESALQTVKTILAIHESSNTGKNVLL